jgi:hypothetical protein
MPDANLIAFLGLDFSHLGVKSAASSHRLRMYTDPKHILGGIVYRVIIQHPIKDQIVRYLPGDNAAQVAQAVEQHLHQLWGRNDYVVSCSEYDVRSEPPKVVTDKRMGF